jgi:hypothetical protein
MYICRRRALSGYSKVKGQQLLGTGSARVTKTGSHKRVSSRVTYTAQLFRPGDRGGSSSPYDAEPNPGVGK